MTQRRSLTDTLSKTAEDFIQQGKPSASSVTKAEPVKSPEVQPAASPKPKPEPPAQKFQAAKPDAPLISVTYRMPGDLITHLVRESTERKIRRVKPWTQQEIVALAVEEWLNKNASK